MVTILGDQVYEHNSPLFIRDCLNENFRDPACLQHNICTMIFAVLV